MLQPNSMYSYQKALAAQSSGLPSSVFGPIPSHNVPQPPSTQSVSSTPTNAATAAQSTPPQTPTHPASVNPTTTTTAGQSQPTLNDVQPPTTVPAQFTSNPHVINNSPMRPYVPDPVNLQYITSVAPVPLQQVQFVPCMCPVAVSISSGMTPDIVANKRSDDIPLSADYRDISMGGEQPLSEER